ncbi:PH and SEC7 domain-containing protein C11E3.11c [Ceratocystis fimbriata CBS 114723]|uniref:PH and SEC7 domain-containing protein C11E3.11c n=1 Tax=Ceratocystis fimbriata CBS 114723 TaxID=1035309 RepID=A0A2C5X8G4_9PEZI|nr:PH and SEC7 domain-containing protein C11E3.11c [Ceratocystis fimbriata CBS 114723]
MPRPYSSRGAAAGAASVATPISTATISTSTRPQKSLLTRKAKAPLTLPLEPSSSTKTTQSPGLQLDWDLTLSPLSASFARGSASALRSAGLATPQKSTFGFDLDFGGTATSAGRGSISTRSVSTSASFNDMASSKRISSIGSFYYEASETFDNQPDFHSADEALAAGAPTSPLRATVSLSTLATGGEGSVSETTVGEKLSLNNKPGPVVHPGLGPSSVSPGGAAGNSAAATNSIVTLTGSPGSGTSQLGHPLATPSGAQISPVLNHRLQSPEANPPQSNATGSGGISRAASTSKGAVNNNANSASSLFSTAPVSSNTATTANQRQSSPTNVPISSTSTSTSTGSTTVTIASTSTTTTTALSAIFSPSPPPSSSSPSSPPLYYSPSPSPASASASAVFSTSSLAALPQPQAKKVLRKKTREQPAVPQIEPPSSQTLVNTAVTSVSSPSAVAAASGPPDSESCLLDSATITPVSFPPDDSASLPSTSSTGMSTSSHEHDYRDYSRQCDRDRDSHDLSLPARSVTRDSLMTNMLLSLDQFSSISSSSPAATITSSADILPGSATATHSTVQPIPISLASHARQQPASHLPDYSSSAPFADRTWSCSTSTSPHSAAAAATVLAHARTRTRTRANTHGGNSYSSDFDIPDDASSRISSRAGRRSNSSSNFYYPPPSGLGRMSSLRSQHTPPRYQIHSRSGRGSKSSSTNSFDGVYIQAVNNQRWIQNQPAFSTPISTASVDYNLSSSSPQIGSTTTAAAQFLQQQNQRDHIFLRQAQSTQSFGLSNKVAQRKPSWQLDHDSSFAGEDYDAAPPPAVPGGPRRIARSASSTVPSSSHGGSPHIDTPVTPRTARPPLPPPPPVESPQPPNLERKRSIRSIKSTATNATRRLDSIKSHQQPHKFETTPPLPTMDGESAPLPNVGYEKTKENASAATPQVQTTQNNGQNPKEKQGFFRRVFGSRAATSSAATATAPSAPQSIESSPVDLPDRTKSQSTPPSRETAPLPHHILQKKTSAFFRRRKKSINDHDAPPPLPMPPPLPTTAMSPSSPPTTTEIPPSALPANGSGTGTTVAAAAAGAATAAATVTAAKTKTTATPTDSSKTVPSTTATSGPGSVLAPGTPLPSSSVLTVLPAKFADHPPEPSPVSSLRKVMNPYLKGSPITGAPSSLGLEEYILPSTPERPANRRHSTTPNDHGYKRSFSPEYDPSPTAVIRKVDRDADSVHSTASENANGSHTPRNTNNAHQMVTQNRQRPSARDTSSNKPSFNASGRANSFLNLDQASDGEGEGDASVVAGYASSKHTRRGIGASEIRRRDRSRDAGLDDDHRSSVLLPIEGVRQDSSDMNGLVSLSLNTANISSGMKIPTIIGGDEKDGALMEPENIDEPDLFVIGDPSDDDRSKAQKIFDGDESFIQREKAAAWMGEEGPVRQRVLRAYMELYDFSNTSIVESLRSVCNRLIFRAETQQVDRILVCYSNRWAACNPKHGFKTIDVIHTICYSIFLLNTDLHMADIEQKMTRSQFVHNTMETIRQALEDSDPDYCDQADNLAVKQQEAGFRSSHQAPSKRSSFLPLRPNDNSGFAAGLADLDECGVLVKAPFEGSFKAWQSVVEIVLKDIYASIRDARLPLMGAEADRYLASGNAHQAGGLSVRGMLKRSPSVLSKTPSESQTSIRGRIPDSSSRNSSSRWPSKSRSRPRFGAPGFSSSRTSFDDQNSVWSPSPSSATWSKQSLGRTQTSMSMDSFGSGFARSDFQQSIGFANALSQSIIRDELPGTASIVDDDMKTSMPLLDDESLELAGPPWIKEGLVSHKHHLDGVDKKAKDRNWSETFAVIQKGKLSIFSFQPNKSMRQRRNARNTRNKGPITVGGGNWQDNATNLGTFDLRQTLASALPPPGYSRTRPHVWALSLPTGAVHLFQAGTEELVKEFVTTVNYWSARLSTHPLVGGISNIEYGWSSNIVNNSLVTAITESTAGVPSASNTTITDTASTKDGVPSISSRPGSSAAVHGRHASVTNSVRSARSASFDQGFGSTMTSAAMGRGKLPGDRVHITDWSPPTQSMRPSKLGEAEQLASLQTYVRGIEADLQVHNQLRSPMLLAFTPRGANAARAMANWERKSAYLLREIVKFRTYVDCLQQAETRRAEIYAEREHARRAARGELDLSGDDQSDVMP